MGFVRALCEIVWLRNASVVSSGEMVAMESFWSSRSWRGKFHYLDLDFQQMAGEMSLRVPPLLRYPQSAPPDPRAKPEMKGRQERSKRQNFLFLGWYPPLYSPMEDFLGDMQWTSPLT